jgi:hypothetical protein
MADQLRADGGVFQANHPAAGLGAAMTTCADTHRLHWSYGYDVKVDSIEVWNEPEWAQYPVPGTENEDGIFYWQCMLDRGWHVTATGGSDSHWLSTVAVQGIGNPTTWVFSTERSAPGVLDAIKAGRTSILAVPPGSGGAPLVLEADADGDGRYESMQGDTVPPGTQLRVRSLNPLAVGLVRVRANGATVVNDQLLVPGGSITLAAPDAGWVWASLRVLAAPEALTPGCVQLAITTYCRDQLVTSALTSALYVDS